MVNVLVVDDDETLARTLKRMLKLTGRFEVVVETSAHAAIARVIEAARSHERFDAVLCDSRMPGANARDVLAAVRKHTDAGFVLMSGEDELADADANLKKPFGRTELVSILDDVIQRPRRSSSCAL